MLRGERLVEQWESFTVTFITERFDEVVGALAEGAGSALVTERKVFIGMGDEGVST